MKDMVIFYLKIIAALLVGWKLGELERKVEDIIDELSDLRKKRKHR